MHETITELNKRKLINDMAKFALNGLISEKVFKYAAIHGINLPRVPGSLGPGYSALPCAGRVPSVGELDAVLIEVGGLDSPRRL